MAGGSLLSRLSSSLLPDILRGVGAAATGASQNAEAERAAQSNYQLGRDRLGLDAQAQRERDLQTRRDLEIRQRELANTTGKDAFTNAMRAQFALGWSPMERPGGVPTYSFVKPLSAQGRTNAEAFEREATQRLLNGEKFDQLPALQNYQLASPTSMPGASTAERLAGFLGLGTAGFGGALEAYRNRQNQQGTRT